MESVKDKRVVNGAAWFFLGLSMFATLIGVITNFVTYSTHMKMGIYLNSSLYIVEAILDILILVAGFFTFKKNRYALIALAALFIIRMFATIPWGGDVSRAYMLGGKTVYLLRDFGLFAIAMCFRKNGISGWRAFFASDEWIEEHYKEKPGAMEKLYGPSQEASETVAVHEPTTVEEPATDNANVEEAIPEPTTPEVEKSIPVEPKKKQRQSFKFKWWHAIVGVVAIIALFFLYLLVKPYPDYLETFSEKWNYAFNKPNNGVANRLFDEAMKHHPNDGFLVEQNGKPEFKLSSDVYREKDLYSNSTVYALSSKRIESKEEVVDTCLYYIRMFMKGNNMSSILTGEQIIDNYEAIEEKGTMTVIKRVIPFNVDKEFRAEKNLMDIVADIPITDAVLAEKVYYYYLDYKNLTLLREYFDKNYKYNKSNSDFLYQYADVLLYTGQYNKAEEVAQSLLKKNEKDSEALSAMAYVSYTKDKWDDAEKYSRKAVDYGTDNPDAYFILAEALYKSGAKNEAQRMYNIGCEKGYSPLESQFEEAGGCPFKIKSIEFAFTNYEGKIITDYGQKLYSSKSQYIVPRMNVTLMRDASLSDVFQFKLYCNGRLETGDESPQGYTYDWKNTYLASKGMELTVKIGGWGASYSGVWPQGNYRFEVYFRNEKVGEETFHIY
ncbi:MAG: tetratricopeptide repeat protein [Bacteroidales bacterium]|nr:tetratricopeptide repeat protein [Bacteroidales bacterium]